MVFLFRHCEALLIALCWRQSCGNLIIENSFLIYEIATSHAYIQDLYAPRYDVKNRDCKKNAYYQNQIAS